MAHTNPHLAGAENVYQQQQLMIVNSLWLETLLASLQSPALGFCELGWAEMGLMPVRVSTWKDIGTLEGPLKWY